MENNKTKSVMLIITHGCNLHCSYCYEANKELHGENAMTLITAKNILSHTIESMGEDCENLIIQFMGGEPLLCFDLIQDVCEWLWSLNLKVNLQISAPTNGTLLSDRMKPWLIKNGHRFWLQLSFDGDPLMHNTNRSSSAHQIDLDFFVNAFSNNGVKMTLSPQTLHRFAEGVQFLFSKGFRAVDANAAMGKNVGWKHEHLRTLAAELDKLVWFYYEHPQYKPMTYFNIPVWSILNKDAHSQVCGCGRAFKSYDIDGTDYPCQIFSPISMSREQALQSRSFDFDQIENDYQGICVSCMLKNLCMNCPGINFRDYGDCNKRTAFNCAQFKLFFLASCKLFRLKALRDNDNMLRDAIGEVTRVITLNKNKQYGNSL